MRNMFDELRFSTMCMLNGLASTVVCSFSQSRQEQLSEREKGGIIFAVSRTSLNGSVQILLFDILNNCCIQTRYNIDAAMYGVGFKSVVKLKQHIFKIHFF
jgi:hypothetical protein